MRIEKCLIAFSESDVAVMPMLLKDVKKFLEIMPAHYSNDCLLEVETLENALKKAKKDKNAHFIVSLSPYWLKRWRHLMQRYMMDGVGPGDRSAHHLVAEYMWKFMTV